MDRNKQDNTPEFRAEAAGTVKRLAVRRRGNLYLPRGRGPIAHSGPARNRGSKYQVRRHSPRTG
jgi:hypothetical protein